MSSSIVEMLSLLAAIAVSVDPAYSLSAPFERTGISEIGNWSLRGAALSWKDTIRLTSEAARDEWGALCQLAPTAFEDWSIEIEVSAHGTDNGGEALFFLYSADVCPQQPSTFQGFQIIVNTSQTDENGFSPILFSDGSGQPPQELSKLRLRLRNSKTPIRILISKSGNGVRVEYTTMVRYVPLFNIDLKKPLPPYGYFSIGAVTSYSLTDNNNLHSVNTRPFGPNETSHIAPNLVAENRKLLESNALKRREAKVARRNALLPTMYRYLGVMQKEDNVIPTTPAEADMRDAFSLVVEAANRGMESVTIDMLKVFINRFLQQTLAGAGSKVNLAMDRFDEARGEIGDMWSYLRTQLIELAADTKAKLDTVTQETIQTVVAVHGQWAQMPTVHEAGVPTAADADGKSGVATLLIVVMLLELVAYVIFFVVKHRKTHGFKKVD